MTSEKSVASSMSFETLASKVNPNLYRGTLVCFDPGETTGFAMFEDGKLVEASQLQTGTIIKGVECVDKLFATLIARNKQNGTPIRMVLEDYRVYGWKTDTHAWNDLHTAKFVGALIAMGHLRDIPYTLQMAQQAKGFCTDQKLNDWGYYSTGLRHARDAIRHGCYYLMFTQRGEK